MSARAESFDVIVIGGGHAGCEAASAAARMGAATALVTHRFATIGAMSCNPAIGGLGKGHLVREVDALDGLMGRVADAGGIQFRVLNRRKGPAVRGPRAQADRKLYAAAMQAAIRRTANLSVIEGEADELLVTDGRISGIRLADGREFSCGAVVVTTGTFLRGLIHLGEKNWPAGRVGEAPRRQHTGAPGPAQRHRDLRIWAVADRLRVDGLRGEFEPAPAEPRLLRTKSDRVLCKPKD